MLNTNLKRIATHFRGRSVNAISVATCQSLVYVVVSQGVRFSHFGSVAGIFDSKL